MNAGSQMSGSDVLNQAELCCGARRAATRCAYTTGTDNRYWRSARALASNSEHTKWQARCLGGETVCQSEQMYRHLCIYSRHLFATEKPSAIANRCLRTDDTSHRTRKHGSCTGHQTPRRRNGVRCNRASMRHGRLPLDVAPGGGTALHVSPRRTRGASCCSLREERHRGRHWHRHHLLTRRHLCWRSRTCVHAMVCEV